MKKDATLVLLSALLLIISFAPFNLFYTAWFALVPLFCVLEGRGARSAFLIGLFWGLIFFLGTVYWVVNSMSHYGGVPVYIGVSVLLLLCLYMSLYSAFFGVGFYISRGSRPLARLFFIASLWVGLEYLRGHLFTGFPWVLLGYSQTAFIHIIQITDITGVYGASFIIILFNYLLYLIVRAKLLDKRRVPVSECVAIALIVLLVFSYGFFRIRGIDKVVSNWERVNVGVVQGNISQSQKWNQAIRRKTIETYRKLTLGLSQEGAELILWPETAMPFYLQSKNELSTMTYEIAKEANSYIITGSPGYKKLDGSINYYNSAFLLSPKGKIVDRYDKVHLVPFGEYVPLKKMLFFIDKLTEGVGDFTQGREVNPLLLEADALHYDDGVGAHSVGVLICFESIFPSLARRLTGKGADLMAVMTNDAWFDWTSAPYQHFDMAVFRAIENRIFLLRAANTGVSGIIDPVGRVMEKGGLFKEEAIFKEVRYKRGELTFYTRYGDIFAFLCIFSAIVVLLSQRKLWCFVFKLPFKFDKK